MTCENTLCIIKPDAIYKNIVGIIINRLENFGLSIIAAKMIWLKETEAKNFYCEHKDKNFFVDLINFMSSGPIIVQVLQGENAILRNRELMGATDPLQAVPGTLRFDYADSIMKNIVHGSDSMQSARREISFFFSVREIYSKL